MSPVEPVTAIFMVASTNRLAAGMPAHAGPGSLAAVSTRKLILLSLACGLAILGAFALQLLIAR